MFYDDPAKHNLKHNPFKALVSPRPIAWVSSMDTEGALNLAPFSFFNALSYNPPYVMFSAGCRDDGTRKDTVVNAEDTGEFVYNMATWDQREQMNQTGLIVDRDTNELAETGLEGIPSTLVSPPRIKGSPVQFECRVHETVVLPGDTKMAIHHAVFGVVVGVHIDDDAISDDGIFEVARVKPIARLGYKDYSWVDETNMFEMEKRTPEELIGKPQRAAE